MTWKCSTCDAVVRHLVHTVTADYDERTDEWYCCQCVTYKYEHGVPVMVDDSRGLLVEVES